MRYSFHGHESKLDLDEVLSLAPALVERVRRAAGDEYGDEQPEDAIAFVLDVFGAEHVHQQRAHLEIVLQRWAHLAPLARTLNDQERIRAIPERLAWRFQTVWPDGRAALFLMLRSVMYRTGCSMHWAPMCVEKDDVDTLLHALLDGLRAGFAATVDAQLAIDLLAQRAARPEAAKAPAAPAPAPFTGLAATDPGM